MNASRGSSRFMIAARSNSGASSVGTSFMLCTARLMRLSARASSISLVNLPLVPTLASATSVILSPVVLMISIETSCPCSRSRAATWFACQSASCEPREPMRKVVMAIRLAPLEGQIEDTPNHLVDRGRLRLRRRRFEGGDRGMQQLIDNAAGHRLDSRFLLRRNLAQPPADAVNFRLADGFAVFLQRENRRHHFQRLHPRRKTVHLELDNLFRTLGLLLSLRRVLPGDRLEIVDVVDKQTVQLVNLRRHVARDGNVDEESRTVAAPVAQYFTVVGAEQRFGSARRGKNDIGVARGFVELVERNRLAAERIRQLYRAIVSAIADQNFAGATRHQVPRRQLRHLSRAHQVDGRVFE